MADTNDLASNEPTKEFPNLYKQVLKGGFWVFALRIFTQGLGILRLIILARFLNPEDFGLLGIALLLMSILETFTSTGFNAALVQKQEDIKPYLNVAWTINILRGFILFIAAFFAAPIMAKIKVPSEQYELAKHIIQFISISFVFHGFTNVGTVYFTKEMLFHKRFIIQSLTSVANLSITIAIAIIYRSVWALAIGKVLGSIFACLFSYYMHPFRPKISFEISKAKNLWNFGKWLTAGSILSFIMAQGDDLFVWGYLGVTQLGLYQMAYRISNLPTTEITKVFSQITFPAFSKIQNDTERLRSAFNKAFMASSSLSLPLSTAIISLAPVIPNLLGKKWLPIVPSLKILAIYGALKSLKVNCGSLWNSLNKPHIQTLQDIPKLAIFIIIIYPLTHRFGIIGTSLTILITSSVSIPFDLYLLKKTLNINPTTIVYLLRLPLLCSIIVYFLCLISKLILNEYI